ncbi:hypothetical protein Ancab_001702 [Ancistrocladus abbreviatus]
MMVLDLDIERTGEMVEAMMVMAKKYKGSKKDDDNTSCNSGHIDLSIGHFENLAYVSKEWSDVHKKEVEGIALKMGREDVHDPIPENNTKAQLVNSMGSLDARPFKEDRPTNEEETLGRYPCLKLSVASRE